MLTVTNLTKSYAKTKPAVDHISLDVKQGEVFGFLGPNGAGKTTTIKMITGILRPDEGEIIIDGINALGDPIAAKKKMTYVPDNPDIQKKLKGIEYVNFMADIYDIPKSDRAGRVLTFSEMFEMQNALNNPISSYSHGMQQKIVLIGALVTQPELFILDEPMVGLDPKSSFRLKEYMREMCKSGSTVFFSTHVLEVVEKFCDRVAIIDKGKIIAMGTLEEIRKEEGMQGSLEDIFLELTDHE
jgi:ABC-2 type transport system ATP-binding protein